MCGAAPGRVVRRVCAGRVGCRAPHRRDGAGHAVAHDRVLLQGAHGHAGVLGGHLTIASGRAAAHVRQPVRRGDRRHVGVGAHVGGRRGRLPVVHRPARHVPHAAEAVEDDDPGAARVWARVQHALVGLLVSLCHAHDPDAVVFSGGPEPSGLRRARAHGPRTSGSTRPRSTPRRAGMPSRALRAARPRPSRPPD